MSIKFKVLLLAIIGPTLLAITIFTYAVETIWTSEEAAVVHSAKGIVSMKEYQRFSPDSVNGSESTAGLKRNLEKDDNKIIVTTIQKLNNLMKSEGDLPIYSKQVVFIFDECHRSQFGEAQKNLKKKFKKYIQFGFTGTPIFPQNALGAETTASVFGRELHSYVITDAIRDEKVLKFKVDYNDVRPQFKAIETEIDEAKLSAAENRQALLHPERIREVSQYILNNFRQKTHRFQVGGKGFNAMQPTGFWGRRPLKWSS